MKSSSRSAGTRNVPFTDADILVPLYAPMSERLAWDSKKAPPHNTYIGQVKLLAAEIAFITMGISDAASDCVVVYAGAAGGHHIPALAALFPDTPFHLYDPAPFAIEATDQITIVNGLFTDEIARYWGEYKEAYVIFISDVRTSGDTSEEHESEVASNMTMQARWIELIQPQWWSLKFRIPYTVIEANEPFVYLGGQILYQAYAKPLSMELRLIGNAKNAAAGPLAVSYDSRALEQTVFFHNMHQRSQLNRYENVFTQDSKPYSDREFGHDYDPTYLLYTVKRYLEDYEADASDSGPEVLEAMAIKLTKKMLETTSQGRWTLASRTTAAREVGVPRKYFHRLRSPRRLGRS